MVSVNGAERDRVGAEIHLALAIADRQRRAVAGADHQIVLARKDEPQRERAAKLRQRRLHRLDRADALWQIAVDQMQHDFGIGFGPEHRALGFQRLAQLAEILDDAVVNHGDAFGRMRMRVVLGRLAVGGPAGMADAAMALQRRFLELGFEIFQFAFGAAAIEPVAFQRGDAGGIVTAIFKALERIHQPLRGRSASQNADNPAHADQYPKSTKMAETAPSFS